MNTRVMVTVGIAVLLTFSLVVMGAWILASGEQGTTMMEDQTIVGPMGPMPGRGPGIGGMMDRQPMVTMGQEHMMGPASNRGIWGGYVGSLGSLMVLVFLGMVGLLVVAYVWERPGRPEPAECPYCQRPVETDWTTCPYCGEALVSPVLGEGAS